MIINITSVSAKQPIESCCFPTPCAQFDWLGQASLRRSRSRWSYREQRGAGLYLDREAGGINRRPRQSVGKIKAGDNRVVGHAGSDWTNGQAEEIAAAIALLASERASCITRVTLQDDGSWVRRLLCE